MGKLAGKIALVTGAVSGIGAAVAAGFAREGALVCVADLSPAKVRAAAAELGSGAFGVAVDVSDLKSIQSMVDEVTHHAGHIDIFIIGGDSLYRPLKTFVNNLPPAKPQ